MASLAGSREAGRRRGQPPTACRRGARQAAGSSPATPTTSSRTAYCSRQLFIFKKVVAHSLRRSSFSSRKRCAGLRDEFCRTMLLFQIQNIKGCESIPLLVGGHQTNPRPLDGIPCRFPRSGEAKGPTADGLPTRSAAGRGFKSRHSDHVVADCVLFAATFYFQKSRRSFTPSLLLFIP